MAAPSSDKEYCLVSEQEDKKSVNKRAGDDEPDSDRGDLKKLKESDEKKKKKKSKSRYALFYGSDAEDTDEEDKPRPRDAEERERMRLALGPPIYISNKKAIEEAEKLRAFNRTHGMLFSKRRFECAKSPTLPPPEPLPLPPPPSPPPSLDFGQQLSSLSFGELVRLLEEEFKQLHSSAPCKV